MGGLSSRPRAPEIQYVVQQPAAPIQPSQPVKQVSVEQQKEENEAHVRSDNLLRRQRGRAGTILTGFRGLSDAGFAARGVAGRKTLLGE